MVTMVLWSKKTVKSLHVFHIWAFMGTCGVMWLSPESQLWDHTAWANGFVPQTVNHDEEALYPRLCFSDLCYSGRSQTQVNFLLMKNPLLPSAFDHSLVISSLRLEPPLLWASLLSESNRKPLFSTGNPTLVFNKGFFFLCNLHAWLSPF